MTSGKKKIYSKTFQICLIYNFKRQAMFALKIWILIKTAKI